MIKCFYIVEQIVEEATESMCGFEIDELSYGALEYCCGCIDELASDCDAISYEVFVDEDNKDVSISVDAPIFSIGSDNKKHFKPIMERIKSIGFLKSEHDGNVRTVFTFPSIWVEVF